MSVTLYKDFHKETKDLLSKMHSEPGKWKLESKVKCPKEGFVVNPSATNDGITAEVEYKTQKAPVSAKVAVAPAGIKKVTLSYTYATKEAGSHTVDVATDAKFSSPEVSCEGKYGMVGYHEKITKKAVDTFVSYMIIPGLCAGVNTVYDFEGKALSYAVAGRWNMGGRILDAATKNFKTFTVGAYSPVAYGDYKGTVAAEIDYGKNGTKVTTGFETACPLVPANKLRTKISSDKKCTASYIIAMPTWKGAVSVNAEGKFGAYFLLEGK